MGEGDVEMEDSVVEEEDIANHLREQIKESIAKTRMHGQYEPLILPPAELKLLHKKKLGDEDSKFYLAQHTVNQKLVAIKGKKGEGNSLESVALKDGLLSPDPVPLQMHGFLPIKPDSVLSKYCHQRIPLVSSAAVTPALPRYFSIGQACQLVKAGELPMSDRSVWKKLVLLLLDLTRTLNNGYVLHGDLNVRNVCVVVHNNNFRLCVLDFGSSKRHDPEIEYEPTEDTLGALRVIQELTEYLEMSKTNHYVYKILKKPHQIEFSELREELINRMDQDLSGSSDSSPQ